MIRQAKFFDNYILFYLIVIPTISAQFLHSWRGSDRDGIYPETGLLKTKPLDAPELSWKTLDIRTRYFFPINILLNFNFSRT